MGASLTTEPPRGRSFLEAPLVTDLGNLAPRFADFAFLGIPFGVPYDMYGVAPPAAAAPHAVREAGNWFIGELHHYDFDLGGPLFPDSTWRIADCGDVPGDPRDLEGTARAATRAARAILEAGAVPLVVGGDHAIPPLVVAAYRDLGPLQVVHIDAHLDFRDELRQVRGGYSSTARRLRDMPWVDGIMQVGLRGPGSARPEEVTAAKEAGNVLVPAAAVHREGVPPVLELLPKGARYYVTLDVDALDPSVAPGTQWPLPGGLTYLQVADLLRGVAAAGEVVGIDVCEFAPSLDHNRLTALAIARLLMTVMGTAARSDRNLQKRHNTPASG